MAIERKISEELVALKNHAVHPKVSKKTPNMLLIQFLILGLLAFGLVIFIWFSVGDRQDCINIVRFDVTKRKLYLIGDTQVPIAGLGKNTADVMIKKLQLQNGYEYIWESGSKLTVIDISDNCTELHWSKLQDQLNYPMDCFYLEGKHWYGGGEMYQQVWPFEKTYMELAAYYPQDMIAAKYYGIPSFGPILGRYWVNSGGIAIIVNQSSPLIVSINAKQYPGRLCLSIDPGQYPKQPNPPELKYTVCAGDNVKSIHQSMTLKYFKKITKTPDVRMMKDPIWSTWVKYSKGVNEADVDEFIDEIVSNNFSCSQLEIDDKYSTKYGDYNFDPIKFPNPTAMIEKIHNASCRVTAWVHPFAEMDSDAYHAGRTPGYFVVAADHKTPGVLQWWNGYAVAVDVTNPKAYDWFLNRLKAFQNKYRIDSFKFDAGSVTYLPYQYTLNGSNFPSEYSVTYAKLASEINDLVEVRVGDNSQDLSVFVRILDRDAEWDTAMGLQSVIPTVLTLGILGYPFILPDMIGGNGAPDKELFIRWMQMNTFLPSMQFSHVPWDFDNETVAIAQNMMVIRKAIMPALLQGVNNTIFTGDPIIRPLWWVAPNDENALAVDQQFMVADTYLVAPVVTQGATNITVYLPKGVWLEEFGSRSKHVITVGSFITFNVTIADICYFRNVTGFSIT